jgi:lipoate-protein ligase A
LTRERWRYLDHGARTGAGNMAVDEALLESHAAGHSPPCLRVYTWRPSAVSLGRFQRAEDSLDLAACRRLGLDIVGRPTGGRAILHTEEEVTFSLVASAARLGASGVMDCYRRIAAAIVAGLVMLGVEAGLVERSPSGGGGRDPACFAVKARCDLVVGTTKLVGSAQVQRNGYVLQQNSLPLAIRLDGWREVFLRETTTPAAVGLWEASGRELSYGEVARALRQGFEESFGVSLEGSELTEAEQTRAAALMRDSPPVLAHQGR